MAVAAAVAALLIETLLFRGLLDVSGLLNLGGQRLAAAGRSWFSRRSCL